MNTARAARLDARHEALAAAEAHLLATERAIDDALSTAAEMIAALPRLRAQARLSPTFGHGAVAGAMATATHLHAAMEAARATHSAMADGASVLGYRTNGIGAMDKPPEDTPKPPPQGRLQLVAAASNG